MVWVQNATPAVNAQSQYPMIIAVSIPLSIASMLVVCWRLHIRSRNRRLSGDDYMALLAMVFAATYSGLCVAQTRYGLGLPIALRPPSNLVLYTRVNYAGRPIYQLGISFFKVALLTSYFRLLDGTNRRYYRVILWVCIVVIFLAHLGCALSLILACDPVDKSWNPKKPGHCLPAGSSFTGYAIVTIFSDVVVVLVPIPVLLTLNIRLNQKIGLCCIFLLGFFTTACSIFRYLQINRIQHGDGNSTMLVLWGTIEFNVGNIVSSLPFLAPVIKRRVREYRSKRSGNYYNSYESNGKSGDATKTSAIGSNAGKPSSQQGVLELDFVSKANNSKERILDEWTDATSIMKTMEYDVHVHRKRASDEV